jgi:hypothetical protein
MIGTRSVGQRLRSLGKPLVNLTLARVLGFVISRQTFTLRPQSHRQDERGRGQAQKFEWLSVAGGAAAPHESNVRKNRANGPNPLSTGSRPRPKSIRGRCCTAGA